ncbi:hypothetical protein LXL04_007042 [Taraxacum kok-saghyz]
MPATLIGLIGAKYQHIRVSEIVKSTSQKGTSFRESMMLIPILVLCHICTRFEELRSFSLNNMFYKKFGPLEMVGPGRSPIYPTLIDVPEAAFKAAWPTINPSFLKPTRGETPVRSTQACFPPIHPKTKISAGLRVDLPSSGSVKKLTGASFLADIPARLNTSKRTSLTMSCRYLKPGRSLQCTACSPNESKHALRQIGHNSSTGKSGIKRRYLRMVRYSTGDICWPRPSMGITRRKS